MIESIISSILARRHNPRNILAKLDYSHNFFIKNIMVAIDELCLKYSQYLPKKAIDKMQINQIRHLLIFAYENIPFWNQKFKNIDFNPNKDFNHLSDLQRIAIVSRSELKISFPKLCVVKNITPDKIYLNSTSGSTGTPFQFYGDKGMLNRRLAHRQRLISWLSNAPGKIIKIMKSNHPGLESEGILFKCSSPRELEKRRFELYPLIMFEPVILESLSSFMLYLTKLIKKDGIEHNIKAIIAASEPMSQEEAVFIEKTLKCPVFRSYGTREVMTIAQECEFHNFHINSEWLYLEILDENGNQLPDGHIGNIVITMFENKAMPLIRYFVGDKGKIVKKFCPCDRTLPILSFEGRLKERVILPGGQQSHHLEIGPAIWQFTKNVKQYQIVQKTANKITINLVPESNHFFTEEIKNKIINDIKKIIGNNINISVVLVDEILPDISGKRRTFIPLKENIL